MIFFVGRGRMRFAKIIKIRGQQLGISSGVHKAEPVRISAREREKERQEGKRINKDRHVKRRSECVSTYPRRRRCVSQPPLKNRNLPSYDTLNLFTRASMPRVVTDARRDGRCA